MSNQPHEISRRELLRNIGISVTLGTSGVNAITAEAAQHVHAAVKDEKAASPKAAYKPKCFTTHEYKTLQKLADLIIPADETSKGALDAGAPEFIDLLSSQNAELAAIYTGGIGWLDAQMRRRYRAAFIESQAADQTTMLDLIAYRKNESPDLTPGITFFTWARNMTVDAYFTSKVGMDYLGFKGNGAMKEFSVPVEAIQYAVKRSGL